MAQELPDWEFQREKSEEAADLRGLGRPVTDDDGAIKNDTTDTKKASVITAPLINPTTSLLEQNQTPRFFTYDRDGNIIPQSNKFNPIEQGKTNKTPSSNDIKSLNDNPDKGDAEYYDDFTNLFVKPEDPEEQARRERGMAMSESIGQLGNSISALSNLFFVGHGAQSMDIPGAPDYGEAIDKYRKNLDTARNNYSSLQQKIIQLRQQRQAMLEKIANDKEKKDAYVVSQNAAAAARNAQKSVYEETARAKKAENDWKESPEYKAYQNRTASAKAENEEAKVGATNALTRQRTSAANKNDRTPAGGGKSGSSSSGAKNTVIGPDGTVKTYTDEEIKKMHAELERQGLYKNTKETGHGSKKTSVLKQPQELANDISEYNQTHKSVTHRHEEQGTKNNSSSSSKTGNTGGVQPKRKPLN